MKTEYESDAAFLYPCMGEQKRRFLQKIHPQFIRHSG